MTEKSKPELLAPAGDRERLEMAVHYGADAVYLAGTRYGMRAAAGNLRSLFRKDRHESRQHDLARDDHDP